MYFIFFNSSEWTGGDLEYFFQGNFGVASLCLKTDLMTVVQRKEMMERQKNIAENNSGREIGYFTNVINVSYEQLVRHIYQFALFPRT